MLIIQIVPSLKNFLELYDKTPNNHIHLLLALGIGQLHHHRKYILYEYDGG